MQWTGRTELGSVAQYHVTVAGDLQPVPTASSLSALGKRRKSHFAKSSRGSGEEICPDKRCGMRFATEEELIKHLTRTHFKETGAENTPLATARSTSQKEPPPQRDNDSSVGHLKDDDSGVWTRGEAKLGHAALPYVAKRCSAVSYASLLIVSPVVV